VSEHVVTKPSPRPVAETVARLEAVVADKGLKLFAVVDHSREAEAHGLELRETSVVIFGSPVAGTPVMQAAPLAALDLPQNSFYEYGVCEGIPRMLELFDKHGIKVTSFMIVCVPETQIRCSR